MIIYHLLIGNDSYIQTTQDNNKIIKLCQEILLLFWHGVLKAF